jgi:hypothetical protein
MRRDQLSANCRNPYERNLTLDANEVTRKNASFLMAVAPFLITAVMSMVQFLVFENFIPPVPLALGIVACGVFALASVRYALFVSPPIGLIWAASGKFMPGTDARSPLGLAATPNTYRSVAELQLGSHR